MDLRSVTIGIPLEFDPELVEKLKKIVEKRLDPRTFRINLPIITIDNRETTFAKLDRVNKLCNKLNIRWFNVPFDLMNINGMELDFILLLLKRRQNAFINLIVAKDDKIDYNAITQASKIVKKVSKLGDGGYHNFRVGVSCNPAINTPFFPFSYSSEETGFSISLELPILINKIIKENKGLDISEMQDKIIKTIVPELKKLEKTCYEIQKESKVEYHGIDVSIAPYPEEKRSVGKILEHLGLEMFGSNGTLFFTSFLTNTINEIIKQSGIKSVGFNGVMYSLIEDTNLCKCNNQNILSIDSLISYSSVCGCGLDMVPIPGSTFNEEISSIILDIAGLSAALSKPLGVRLLPIPEKSDGELTEFNMDFLCNTRVKKVKNVVIWNEVFKKNIYTYKKKQKNFDKKLIKDFWDRRAKKHEKNPGLTNLEEDEKLLKKKVELENKKVLNFVDLKKDTEIIDLGGGNGYWAFKFAKNARNVVVVDYCQELIKQGIEKAKKEKIKNISFWKNSIQDFEQNHEYDTIFMSGVLIYLTDEDLEKLINNIKSYSKKGTKLILRDSTGIKERYCINKYSEELKANYCAIYRTREEYIRSFKKAGFKLIKDEDMFSEGSTLNKHKETRLRIYEFKRN
jgi:ubiquinone/menaquinone biosynthesis C-methylase UbiE